MNDASNVKLEVAKTNQKKHWQKYFSMLWTASCHLLLLRSQCHPIWSINSSIKNRQPPTSSRWWICRDLLHVSHWQMFRRLIDLEWNIILSTSIYFSARQETDNQSTGDGYIWRGGARRRRIRGRRWPYRHERQIRKVINAKYERNLIYDDWAISAQLSKSDFSMSVQHSLTPRNFAVL